MHNKIYNTVKVLIIILYELMPGREGLNKSYFTFIEHVN